MNQRPSCQIWPVRPVVGGRPPQHVGSPRTNGIAGKVPGNECHRVINELLQPHLPNKIGVEGGKRSSVACQQIAFLLAERPPRFSSSTMLPGYKQSQAERTQH